MERHFNEELWQVWLDKEPPGPAQLRVRGRVMAPSTGLKAVARINPKPRCDHTAEYVVIEVTLVPTGDVVLPVLTPVPVELDEPYPGQPKKARIVLPNGAAVVRDVRVVH